MYTAFAIDSATRARIFRLFDYRKNSGALHVHGSHFTIYLQPFSLNVERTFFFATRESRYFTRNAHGCVRRKWNIQIKLKKKKILALSILFKDKQIRAAQVI